MTKLSLILLVLTSCVSLPHVNSATRSPSAARRATVAIQTGCAESHPLDPGMTPGLPNPHQEWPTIDYGGHTGTGVVISERHILTAYHVISCPIIPTIHLALPNGKIMRAAVLREDADNDLALLEVISADNLELGVPPPILGHVNTQEIGAAQWCAQGLMAEEHCGTLLSLGMQTATYAGRTRPGDSGSGVYDEEGALVGVVTAGTRTATKVARVDPTWLEVLP